MAGRPLSAAGEIEERVVQALALRQELATHDRWEVAALVSAYQHVRAIADRTREGSPDHRDALAAVRALRELILRDRWENERHAEIAPETVLVGVAG